MLTRFYSIFPLSWKSMYNTIARNRYNTISCVMRCSGINQIPIQSTSISAIRPKSIMLKPIMMNPYQQRCNHDWKRHMNYNMEKRKIIPRLVYLHNPWKYIVTKVNLKKLQLFWDPEFVESEFIRGTTQAAAVMTNIIRTQSTSKVGKFTTPIGYQQIMRDMLLSRDDTRLKLVRFEPEHIRRAIPMKVTTRDYYGRKFCFIDMLFVALRNTKDFDTPEEVVEVNEVLRKIDTEVQTPREMAAVPHRILFAEILMRFRRDYTPINLNNNINNNINDNKSSNTNVDWSVSFYKILSFDILNYDPKH